ncbi:hypothetical protein SAMN04487978_2768 [Flavobacterium sp. fv08]|nr:hypothetical protein SAMN04487978_2768 [Flavobacterium sp. fv08]
MWLSLLAILFSVNMQAQMTIGGKKEPEAFSVLELLNKGGLRLPQMTTAERDAFAVKATDKGNGLTIYNKTTDCVEYWNASRWVSLCDGTSQTTISPQPCVDVAADGTGCDQTFNVKDPDCPNGPFTISITAGSEYAALTDVDNVNGSFKINFFPNETVNIHTVLVRVTSSCTSLYKEFLFSQKGVDCSSMSYAVPTMTASATTLCAGGAVYLSVPANTANLDKLIWTRNGKEVARGINYYVATLTGNYNISMGAVGCNTNAANEKNITSGGTITPITLSALASNNGVICGTGKVTLSVSGNGTASVVWFHNGKEEKTGESIQISGDSSVGEWFAAVKDGSCYSKPSNSIQVTKSEATGQVPLDPSDVLVNGVPLNTFTKFCSGGSLYLSIKNQQSGVAYTWYNGNDVITANPFTVPASQSTISLRMVATDNSGAKCAAEQSVLKADITQGSTPENPNINTTSTLCKGKATLTVLNQGNYTYTWYKGGAIIEGESSNELNVTTEGTYGVTITNTTGCSSPMIEKTISGNSDGPNVSWDPLVNPPADQTFGSSITLTVTNSYDSSYIWTMDGVVVPNATGKTATIDLPKTGTEGQKVKIAVTAKNECGEKTIEKEITMNNGCPTPVILSISSAQTIVAKTSVTVSVSVDKTNTETYAWYQNATDSTTGGTKVGNGASYTTASLTEGTYYFYCIVTNGCTGNPKATSATTAKVTVTKNPGDILPGGGSLSGKTCFDVVQINNTDQCGTLASRSSMKADFAPTYTYTFTPSGGAISNFHFQFVESLGTGKIVDSYTTNNYNITIKYNADLYNTAKGTTNADAVKLDIYAIFNDAAGEKAVKLTVQIKDCMCCGAKINATEWREFMCHNLGADTSLPPLSPDPKLVGVYYYFGNSSPDATTALTGSNWKPENNPCPGGYHIPTQAEWQAVLTYNAKNPANNKTSIGDGGVLIGTSLMLPNASTLLSSSWQYLYWSSTSVYSGGYNYGVALFGGSPSSLQVNTAGSYKAPIRCMANK